MYQKKKIYISGAITHDPNYKQHFADAEIKLKAQGYEVVNPTNNTCDSYKEYIDTDLKQLMTCDAIYMLLGFIISEGAKLEYNYARCVGMQVIFEPVKSPWED